MQSLTTYELWVLFNLANSWPLGRTWQFVIGKSCTPTDRLTVNFRLRHFPTPAFLKSISSSKYNCVSHRPICVNKYECVWMISVLVNKIFINSTHFSGSGSTKINTQHYNVTGWTDRSEITPGPFTIFNPNPRYLKSCFADGNIWEFGFCRWDLADLPMTPFTRRWQTSGFLRGGLNISYGCLKNIYSVCNISIFLIDISLISEARKWSRNIAQLKKQGLG